MNDTLVRYDEIHQLIVLINRNRFQHLLGKSKPTSCSFQLFVCQEPVIKGPAATKPIAIAVKRESRGHHQADLFKRRRNIRRRIPEA